MSDTANQENATISTMRRNEEELTSASRQIDEARNQKPIAHIISFIRDGSACLDTLIAVGEPTDHVKKELIVSTVSLYAAPVPPQPSAADDEVKKCAHVIPCPDVCGDNTNSTATEGRSNV